MGYSHVGRFLLCAPRKKVWPVPCPSSHGRWLAETQVGKFSLACALATTGSICVRLVQERRSQAFDQGISCNLACGLRHAIQKRRPRALDLPSVSDTTRHGVAVDDWLGDWRFRNLVTQLETRFLHVSCKSLAVPSLLLVFLLKHSDVLPFSTLRTPAVSVSTGS